METTRHRDDWQVPAALGWARWELWNISNANVSIFPMLCSQLAGWLISHYRSDSKVCRNVQHVTVSPGRANVQIYPVDCCPSSLLASPAPCKQQMIKAADQYCCSTSLRSISAFRRSIGTLPEWTSEIMTQTEITARQSDHFSQWGRCLTVDTVCVLTTDAEV